jgi:peptidyl-prolyl cis-trans isomerase SurA
MWCFAMRKLLLLISAPLLAGFVFADNTVIEDIIARVNNQIITRSEFTRAKEQTASELKQQNVSEADPKFKERDKDVLRDLIDQQLLLEKGKDLGISGDTELIKRLDEMRKQMNLESLEDLEKAAQQQGVSFEDFKQNIRNNIITQQVIGSEVGRNIKISQQETHDFYDKHKAELERPEAVRLEEILVSTQPQAQQDANKASEAMTQEDPAKLQAAEQKANELLKEIRSGAKFEDVAKKSSDGPTASQGGDLGVFKRGELAKELEDKTFSMKPRDVSDVIRTKQGFLILKVADHYSAGIPPLNEVEPQIQEQIYMQKLQPALRAYLTKLREQAYIDLKPGFLDTGASPNQTKPIVTTGSASDLSTASNKKQAKKKKKLGIM